MAPNDPQHVNRYRALCARDARFDGQWFVAVTSTGIYCRPVCRVKTPMAKNCRFFDHAAAAEAAGFRPCLKCRPEMAPHAARFTTEDASAVLAQAAMGLIDAQATASPRMETIAEQLGVSERHMRRLFEAHAGVSPLQYAQTRKLLAAKQLLTDTALPVADVALASGFESVRRFNDVFVQAYRMSPSRFRADASPPAADLKPIRLGFRPPYALDAMLAFLQARCIDATEYVATNVHGTPATPSKTSKTAQKDGSQWHWRRTIRLADAQGRSTLGWFALRWDLEAHQVLASAAPELHAHWPQLIARLRRALDLDADTTAVEAALSEHLRITNPGVRVSGAFDGFEVAVRAILGQQVTVAAARTFARRVVERLGEPIETPWPDMSRVFPTAQTLARVEPSVLGEMGIVRQRQAAIQALALAVQNGLDLNPGCANATQREATLTALQALPGIGAWTAQYIAMRCLRHTDAWPAGDIVLHNALNLRGITSPTARAKACEAASESLKPWRAYAVIRLWDGSATLKEPT